MFMIRHFAATLALAAALGPFGPSAQAQAAKSAYQMEWVYRVKYGFQDEWWRIFQKYEIAALDEEKRLGYVVDYYIDVPDLHASEDVRWDYRIIITFKDRDAATHEDEVTRALFADQAAFRRDENRRWELTANHWDLPIHKIDPHTPSD